MPKRPAYDTTKPGCQGWRYRITVFVIAGGFVLLQLLDISVSVQDIFPRKVQTTTGNFTTAPNMDGDTTSDAFTRDFNLAPLSPLNPRNNSKSSCPSKSLANQGAVFVFFHLPKAAGTTIRSLFQDPPISAEMMVRVNPSAADMQTRKWLADPKEKRNLFVELHDGGNPSVEPLTGQLRDWRKMASLHNRPLFIFTVVREPVSDALSYFTYMNVANGHLPRYHHWNGGRQAQLTNHDLLDFTLPSPQCLFYSRGELATTTQFPIYGSKWNATKECPQVYHSMTKYMDWIGTVETMQDQMLPLLTYLSNNDPEIGRNYKKMNPSNPKVKEITAKAKANETTMAALETKVESDVWIYDQVQKDFQWNSFWSGCIPEITRSTR